MRISLNSDTWHSKYYKWVLNTQNLPKSLCPYFWSLSLFLVTSPLIVVGKLLYWIFSSIGKALKRNKKVLTWEEEMEKDLKISRIIEKIGKIFFGFLSILFLFIFFAILYGAHQKHSWAWLINKIIFIIGCITTFIGLIWVMIETIKWMKLERITKIKLWLSIGNGWNVFTEFIISTKEKACPIIDWTNK